MKCRFENEHGYRPCSCSLCEHFFGMVEHCYDYEEIIVITVTELKKYGLSPCFCCSKFQERKKCDDEQIAFCQQYQIDDESEWYCYKTKLEQAIKKG